MVDLFKKKSAKSKYINTITGQTKKRKDETDKKVVVHTMPDRFFAMQPKVTKSKQTGVIIMVGGIVLLTIIFAVAYILFVKNKAQKDNDRESAEEIAVLDANKKPESKPAPEKSSVAKAIEDKEKEKEASMPIEIEDKIIDQNSNNSANDNNLTEENNSDNRIVIPNEKLVEAEATTTDNISNPGDVNNSTTTVNDIIIIIATTTNSTDDEIIIPPVEVIIEPSIAVDTDHDGLSDAEELLLGSNSEVMDSDQDGFNDKAEILNLYNPAGEGKIIANTGIERYISEIFGYLLYYPVAGTINQIGGEDNIMIRMENGQFFQISIQPDSINTSLDDWYKQQFEVDLIKSTQNVFKQGWSGVRSEDRLTLYLTPANSKTIYTLSYNLGLDNTFYYMNIFEIMIRSLELKS